MRCTVHIQWICWHDKWKNLLTLQTGSPFMYWHRTTRNFKLATSLWQCSYTRTNCVQFSIEISNNNTGRVVFVTTNWLIFIKFPFTNWNFLTVLCHKFGYNRSGAVIESFIGKYQIILYQIERIIGNINSTMYQNHLCVEQISCITWLLAEFFDEKSVFWTYIDCRKKSRNKLARKKSTRNNKLELRKNNKIEKKLFLAFDWKKFTAVFKIMRTAWSAILCNRYLKRKHFLHRRPSIVCKFAWSKWSNRWIKAWTVRKATADRRFEGKKHCNIVIIVQLASN